MSDASAAFLKKASDYERVKASQLRRKATLTKSQKTWLAGYEARVAAGKASRKSERVANTNASFAQTTAPPSAIDPDAHAWNPSVPEPMAGEEPPAPGVVPPQPGTPIVDQVAPPAAADNGAAQQAAFVMAMIVRGGIAASMELLADFPLPDQYRAMLQAPEAHNQVIMVCSGAAYRLAIKYNAAALPMSDEITVATAIAASAAAWFAVHKRKAKANEAQRAHVAKDANPPEADPRFDPANPGDGEAVHAPPPVPGFSWGRK